MAPKRRSAKEDPPSASSSESESDPEPQNVKQSTHKKPKPHLKKPVSNPNPVPYSTQPASSSESESDSDSDSPSPDHKIEPISSKPIEQPKSKKPKSKTDSAKRQSEIQLKEPNSKRSKKKSSKSGGEEDSKKQPDDSKKPLFQRLFSEEDEIVILEGAVDFIAKEGIDPSADMIEFFESVKKSLQASDVSKGQLADKYRRLKKKFHNNVIRGKKGEKKTFTKSIDQRAFDLSKKIWGSEREGGLVFEPSSPNRKPRKNAKESISEGKKFSEKIVNLGVHNGNKSKCLYESSKGLVGLNRLYLKEGLERLEHKKYTQLEEKWRELRVKEIELYSEWIDLEDEEAKLVLEAQNAAVAAAAVAVVGH